MMHFLKLKKVLFVAMLSLIATGAMTSKVFADDAPVYDVDSYPPQFDDSGDGGGGPDQPTHKSHASVHADAKPPVDSVNKMPDDAPSTPMLQPLNLDQRVARLEQQITNALHSDVTSKMTDLQTEIQNLRGEVEDLTHQIQQLETQQKSMYSDLDKRISTHQEASNTYADEDTSKAKKSKAKASLVDADGDKGLPTATAPIPADEDIAAAKPVASGQQPNVAEEQQIYQTAYSLIKAKKYDEAAETLKKMLQKYPSGQFAANAHYWLGELYGLMGKNDQSISEFDIVVKNYPDSPKIADAQLKLGLIFAAQLKWPDAKTSFKKVINRYPGTSSAHLAAEQLKQIKVAGH